MSEKKVLINMSNIHSGGALQVATSVLYELALFASDDLSNIHIVASSEIYCNILKLRVNIKKFASFDVINTRGIGAVFSSLNRRVKGYEVVFTLFGPNYLRRRGNKEIVGFAQLWIVNFDNEITKKLPSLIRCKLRMKFFIQWLFFLRADYYIVELEHVRKSLHCVKNIPKDRISVVHNTVSSLYKNRGEWRPINLDKGNEQVSIGIITRDHVHKNLDILPKVAETLKVKYKLEIHFYTTLNDEEWSRRSPFFKKYVSTVGSLFPEECPSFYQQVDGVIFPSLLECFSATPLEAMVMQKPLFASDRGFVRDVCHDYAIYFDPLDPDDIALKIANYFQSGKINKVQLQEAKEHAFNFSSAKGRAEKYLQIINNHLEEINYV